jgi:hypothetical protein
MKLFIGASWFTDKKTPCVYNLSCLGVHGRHTTVQFDCAIALDMFIPERVLTRTGKSAFEMKQGMSESDAIKLLHDIAEKAEAIVCYSKSVCDLLHVLSERNKFKRKINALTLAEYFFQKTNQSATAEEILSKYAITSKSTERTSLDDCNVLKDICVKISK